MVDALRRVGLAEVDDSTLTRALYSSDASLYRVTPTAVVRPRDVDEVAATLDVCRTLGVPLTSRGAGTSIAGNAVGTGVVLEFSKHLNRVRAIDPEARTATVEPGVVQAQLQRAVAPHGLRFGPDPSTHNRATLGGMIGNNACGSRALGYGRTADNVLGLQLLTGTGLRLDLGADGPAAASEPLLAELRSVVGQDLATIRTELGRFSRQVSGYSLEHLLPERSFDVPRALVGSEGTLGVVLGATVRLVAEPAHRGLVVLGYPDMATAADAVPALLVHRPTACEGIDGRILDVVRGRRGPGAVPAMPRGNGWLLVEVTGQSPAEVAANARAVVADAGALDSMVVTDPRTAAGLWRIREDGAGLAGRTPVGAPAHSGWEDAAVPPAVLGAYLRDFERLLADYRLAGVPYGHFGDGCVHIRIDFPFETRSGVGVFRGFLTEAATLVAGFGGSLSGEHGDGRARSALLPLMYSGSALALFGRVKALFDPDNLLNPGVLVDPRPVDADLRVVQARPLRKGLALGYRHDGGDFSAAVHRCTGVGKCLADTTADGGVMCPSYLATREEKDSTRGRARALQEMVNGTTVTGGWRAPEVREALDLCLACKGCSSDCPTGVDMASYKAEVLHQSYRRRLRPRSHYTLGWLPRWSRLASRAPRLANAVLGRPALAGMARWAAGVDSRRGLPRFAEVTFHRWFSRRTGGLAQRGPPPGRAVRGQLHRALPAGGGDRGGAGPRGRRVRGPADAVRPVLRADLDHDRAAGHRESTGGANGFGPAARGRGRGAGRRPGALVHGHAAVGRRGAARHFRRCDRGRRHPHPGRAAAGHPGLDRARPHRDPRRRAAALPPPGGDGLGRRRAAAGRRRRGGRAAGRLLRAGRQLRRRAGALRRVGGRGRERAAARDPRPGARVCRAG